MGKKQFIDEKTIRGNDNAFEFCNQFTGLNDVIIKNIPVGIIVINSNCQIQSINSRGLEIFDLNRIDVNISGQTKNPTIFTELLTNSEMKRWQYMINSCLTSKDAFSDDRYFHNTGYIEKVLSIKLSPILLPPKNADGLIITLEDITDKVLCERYVILSEKLVAKGEMTVAIAHELSNYLAIAVNNAELLSRNIDMEKYEKAKFNSKSIVENIFKLKKIIENLKSFAEADTQFIVFDIKTLIKDIIISLRIQPRFKQTSFTIDLKQNIPNIEMDVALIQQVLMNILNNAADAILEKNIKLQNEDYKSEIAILSSYDSKKEVLTLIISDNGIGIKPDNINKIYNMHYTTKKNGYGLGLFNTRKIIKQHKGDIKVESEASEGTTFIITLPRFQPKPIKELK
jgi:signal transduction histidine kinase